MRKFGFAARAAALLAAAGLLTACAGGNVPIGSGSSAAATEAPAATATDKPTDAVTVTDAPTADPTADAPTDAVPAAEEGLSVTTEVADGYVEKNNVYTIVKGGEYTFTGTLSEGRIVVDAAGQEVSVILSGVTLSSSEDSVILIENVEEATVVAQNGTVNTLNDNRARKVGNQELAGNACIYSKDDLNIQGKGTLYINAAYNKGIHSKNDVKVKNLTLNVNAVGTALQGNDSVTIKSGNITLVSSEDDGIKTKDTDVSAKGKQRGIISIESGTVVITAADECLNAAYDVDIAAGASVTQNKY